MLITRIRDFFPFLGESYALGMEFPLKWRIQVLVRTNVIPRQKNVIP